MVDLKKDITESNPDDLDPTKVIYSDIHPDIQRPPTAQLTNHLLTSKYSISLLLLSYIVHVHIQSCNSFACMYIVYH